MPLLAEQFDLLQQLVVVVDLRVAGGEHAVPEQRHLLLQRALGVHQIVHVVDVAHRRLTAGQQRRRLMPQQRVGIHRAAASRGSAIPRRSRRSPWPRAPRARPGSPRSPHAASDGPSDAMSSWCAMFNPPNFSDNANPELLSSPARHGGTQRNQRARRNGRAPSSRFGQHHASVRTPGLYLAHQAAHACYAACLCGAEEIS